MVFLEKGVVSMLRDLLPSQRRRLQPLLLMTQRQVSSILFWVCICTYSCLRYYILLGVNLVNMGVVSWQVRSTSACYPILFIFRVFKNSLISYLLKYYFIRLQLLRMMMMMMWTFLVKRLKRRRRLQRNVLLLSRHLAKRKSVSFLAYFYCAYVALKYVILSSSQSSFPLVLTRGFYFSTSAGKSSVLLDVKPWDDETDMKQLEEAVRSVHMEGLLWGACMFFICDSPCC